MRLVEFKVEKFRNVIDSELVAVESDVTCLVGKNESGKTTILNALYRLNPAYEADFVVSDHYPRWLMTRDRKADVIKDVKAITGVFELADTDIDAVEERFGKGVLADGSFTYIRSYGATKKANVGVVENAAITAAYEACSTSKTVIETLAESETLADVRESARKKVAELAVDADRAAAQAELEKLLTHVVSLIGEDGTLWIAVVGALKDRMPKFFYFSQYSVLPGRVRLDELGSGSDGPAKTSLQTVRALLALAGTSIASLGQDDYEERKAELEAVSNELTQEVFEYWSQNEQLEVSLDVDKETIATTNGNPGQTAVAQFLDIRVRDKRHGFTSNFGERSAGFQWFFSFLAAFSEFDDPSSDVVVLLDEPGSALHARAQADFLRFINERLAPSAQVIYTTHSPFMVESDRLSRVRVVEDKGPKKGAVVSSEVLSVGNDTLFPLQAALGYDISQHLFIGPNNLLVEGTSDFTYLSILSDHLVSIGREGLDPVWRILPSGGVNNIPAFVALMGRKLDVTVLVDSGAQGMQRLTHMSSKGLLSAHRLITIGQIIGADSADIEDLFAIDDYLKLYNPAFGSDLSAANLKPGGRLVDRIGRTQGTEFTDHGRPADYLLRNRDQLLEALDETTLNNFEAVIKLINQTKSA